VLKVSGLNIDVSKMLANKNKAVTGLTGGIEFLFKKVSSFCGTLQKLVWFSCFLLLIHFLCLNFLTEWSGLHQG
jgi:hypothetical protein